MNRGSSNDHIEIKEYVPKTLEGPIILIKDQIYEKPDKFTKSSVSRSDYILEAVGPREKTLLRRQKITRKIREADGDKSRLWRSRSRMSFKKKKPYAPRILALVGDVFGPKHAQGAKLCDADWVT